MSTAKYDEALFRQILKKENEKKNFITTRDIENAFWKTAWDLEEAIIQQKPEQLEAARATFRREMLPIFTGMLKSEGYHIVHMPSVSPFEALKRLQASETKEFIDDEGFVYTLDGGQMAPSEFFFPVAIDEDGQPFFPAGEEESPITEETEWVC